MPGRVALALDSEVISDLRSKLRDGAMVVCGTNGKTTTNNVLAGALEAAGEQVLCNRDGANMKAGVAAAMLEGRWANWAVMEVDELSSIHIVPALRPRYFVLLNLFRDQLDRAGEIDHVQDVIVDALAASPETTLIACGDDPLCMGIARRAQEAGTKVLTFGIGEDMGLAPDRVPEARFCQVCGAELDYAYRSYAQLGAFSCPNGDFERPELDFCATQVRVDQNGVSFSVRAKGLAREVRLEAGFGGVYMVYNLLAAFAAASLAGVPAGIFSNVLADYDPHNGRLQHFEVEGREVVLNLAKNPTGFNQNISLLLADKRAKQVFFVINDNPNDGRDISWIWDVDFERLAQPAEAGEMRVLAGGIRANDVQVRLKYAGVSAQAPLAGSVEEALSLVREQPLDEPLYVLCNYSALWPVKAELEEKGRSL
ncbi:MAG: MurT ligase domain-containing protein [Coriobacteriales bacterium]|nr:MurT ligase domain-containing protein [Coriobacteriales bacterium]